MFYLLLMVIAVASILAPTKSTQLKECKADLREALLELEEYRTEAEALQGSQTDALKALRK